MKPLIINDKKVADGFPTYIIAEIGFNHGGDIDLATKMIEAASQARVDAVKFQTYRASELVLKNTEHFNTIKRGELSLRDHQHLVQIAHANGTAFISSPYDLNSVDILEKVNVPAYKVASMDLTNLPLLEYISTTGKPMIVSTGMSTLGEIAEAVETIKRVGNDQIILLHCVSKYPASPEHANLRTISLLKDTFGLPVGYSDHVLGNATVLASVALGACLIEKHFTTNKALPGPDHKISADPYEMAQLINDIRIIEKSLGKRNAFFDRPDRKEGKHFRRSLFARIDIPVGTVITEKMVKCVRPEKGLLPKYWNWVIGRTAKENIKKDQPITWDYL